MSNEKEYESVMYGYQMHKRRFSLFYMNNCTLRIHSLVPVKQSILSLSVKDLKEYESEITIPRLNLSLRLCRAI